MGRRPVELEDERQAVYRTADIMFSVKEKAHKTVNPTESDGLNMKRIDRPLKGVPMEVLDRGERTHGQRLGRSTTHTQEHECRSLAMRKCDTVTLVKNAQKSELELSRSTTARSDHYNRQSDGDEASPGQAWTRGDPREPCRQ